MQLISTILLTYCTAYVIHNILSHLICHYTAPTVFILCNTPCMPYLALLLR